MKLMHSWAFAKLHNNHLLFNLSLQRQLQRQTSLIAIALGCCLASFSGGSAWASGLGGAWSGWLPTNTSSAVECVAKAQQSLARQQFRNRGASGLVAYGDLNSRSSVSVFMICSALGDQLLVLVSSRDVSVTEMERIRARVANDFIAQ